MMLTRFSKGPDGIFGIMKSVGFECHTLEHAYPTHAWLDIPMDFIPKIPEGTYSCVRGAHKLEGMIQEFETFEIIDVAGHSNLLFHVGNYNSDSSGCILLGASIDVYNAGRLITESKNTFTDFMAYMKKVDRFILEIQNDFE